MSQVERRLTESRTALQESADRPPSTIFPSDAGAYALVISVPRRSPIVYRAGRAATFPAGLYVYLGSALGPGGLRARLGRHLRPIQAKHPHWHIDRLLECGKIVAVWWETTHARRECAWAAAIAPPGKIWPPGFGASDCSCPGHLVAIPSNHALRHAWGILKRDVTAMHEAAFPGYCHRSGARR